MPKVAPQFQQSLTKTPADTDRRQVWGVRNESAQEEEGCRLGLYVLLICFFFFFFLPEISFRNLKGTLFLSIPGPPAVLISGSAFAGQIWGLLMANLPEVGAAQAADSARRAFAAIWAEAAVSITFSAQMCQTSYQPSAGYISR